jgi:hypothetical protein
MAQVRAYFKVPCVGSRREWRRRRARPGGTCIEMLHGSDRRRIKVWRMWIIWSHCTSGLSANVKKTKILQMYFHHTTYPPKTYHPVTVPPTHRHHLEIKNNSEEKRSQTEEQRSRVRNHV